MNQTTDYEHWRIQTLIAFPYTQLEFDMIHTVKHLFPSYSLDFKSSGYKVKYFETKEQFFDWVKKEVGIIPLFSTVKRGEFPPISFYYFIKS